MRGPINEGLRKDREERARKFNFDLGAICKDLKERSRDLKVVRLPPKKIGARKKK